MPCHERLAERRFAIGISPGGVEVVSATLKVGVDHFGYVIDVDRVVLTAVESHATEPKRTDFVDVHAHPPKKHYVASYI